MNAPSIAWVEDQHVLTWRMRMSRMCGVPLGFVAGWVSCTVWSRLAGVWSGSGLAPLAQNLDRTFRFGSANVQTWTEPWVQVWSRSEPGSVKVQQKRIKFYKKNSPTISSYTISTSTTSSRINSFRPAFVTCGTGTTFLMATAKPSSDFWPLKYSLVYRLNDISWGTTNFFFPQSSGTWAFESTPFAAHKLRYSV